jgi:iron complex transport system permease protein
MPGAHRKLGGAHILLLLGAGTLIAFALSLLVGPAGFGVPGRGAAASVILWEIRAPRAVLGVLIGAALGGCGAALQGYLRNPLAEPGLIGASAGAALGAVLTVHTGAAGAFALALPTGGLLGAAAAMGLVLALAGARAGPITLILAGVAVTSVATALTALVLNLSRDPFATVEMVYWLMGSLTDRSLTHVWLAAPPILLGLAAFLRIGRDLDALSLGEEVAANLGVDLRRTQRLLVVGTAFSIGAATAVAGVIGFVGLVIPHLLRPVVGYAPGRLIPTSILGGAILVLLADSALRLLAPGDELRLGVFTALLGAPFFLYLVITTRRELAP